MDDFRKAQERRDVAGVAVVVLILSVPLTCYFFGWYGLLVPAAITIIAVVFGKGRTRR